MQTRTARTNAGERRAKAVRGCLKPIAKVTRAHLSIAARPSIRDEALAALNAVMTELTKHLGASVTGQAMLRDATLAPLSQLAQHAVFAVFELGNRSLAVIEIDGALSTSLLAHAAGSIETAALPSRLTRIEEVALAWLALSSLSSLAGSAFAARFAPKFVGLFTQRNEAIAHFDARHRHLAIDLTMNVGPQAGQARVLVPALSVQALIESAPIAEVEPAAASVLAASIELVCLAGSTALTADEASSLIEGDVVMFHGLRLAQPGLAGPGRIRSNTFELRGRYGPDTFTLTHATPLEKPMLTTPDPTAPIDIDIELTRLRVPLHQLGLLKSGTVLPLHINAAQPVTLRIGDRAVAKAELVEIEGEIGARILTLL